MWDSYKSAEQNVADAASAAGHRAASAASRAGYEASSATILGAALVATAISRGQGAAGDPIELCDAALALAETMQERISERDRRLRFSRAFILEPTYPKDGWGSYVFFGAGPGFYSMEAMVVDLGGKLEDDTYGMTKWKLPPPALEVMRGWAAKEVKQRGLEALPKGYAHGVTGDGRLVAIDVVAMAARRAAHRTWLKENT